MLNKFRLFNLLCRKKRERKKEKKLEIQRPYNSMKYNRNNLSFLTRISRFTRFGEFSAMMISILKKKGGKKREKLKINRIQLFHLNFQTNILELNNRLIRNDGR